MSVSPKKIFVIGAGFSVAAGFPLVKQLRQSVLGYLQSHHGQFFFSANEQAQFLEGLHTADIALNAPGRNVDECFEELLIQLRRTKGMASESSAWTTDRLLRCATGRLLWELSGGHLPETYWNFTSHARRAAGIVSFNWETLIESALWRSQIPWGYSKNSPLPVIKPHGSINWSSHNLHGTSADEMWQPIFSGSGISWIPPRSSEDQGDDNDPAFQDPFPTCVNSDLSYLLFPGDPDEPSSMHGMTDPAANDRRAIWDQAYQLILRASSVVFLGYSLPAYDGFAQRFFRDACKGKRVEVVNPSPEDAEGFRGKLGADIEVELKLQKFEDSKYAQKAG